MASTITREEMVDIYKQLPEVLNDFSKILAAIIAAKFLFITNQNVMICLVIMIVVYYLVLVLGTVLQLYIIHHLFLTILSCIMLVLGSAVSVLALILIEPTIAFIIAILWVAVFVLVAIFRRQELCEVKSLISRQNLQSPRPEV